MPRELHERLEKEADALGYTGRRRDAYVYGTMRKVANRMHGQGRKVKRRAKKAKRG